MNNQIRYRSDIADYGTQKFFNRRDCNWVSHNNQQYYQLISARLQEDFIKRARLDECEVLLILKEILKMQYSMVEFNFDEQFFCTLDYFKKHEFFSAQEFMNGKSFCDVYITSETTLISKLKEELDVIQCSKNHLINQFLKNDEKRMQHY